MWTLWREQNRCTFEDREISGVELFARLLFDWSQVRGFTNFNFFFFFFFFISNITSLNKEINTRNQSTQAVY